jgi:hypothetical protein
MVFASEVVSFIMGKIMEADSNSILRGTGEKDLGIREYPYILYT